MNNFVSFKTNDNTSTINILDFRKQENINVKHIDKLNKVIAKLPSGLKTKALTLLSDKKVLALGYGAVNLIDSSYPMYCVNIYDSNTLRALLCDLSKILEPHYLPEALKSLATIQHQQEVIVTNSRMLTATSTLQIDMAKKTIDEKFTDIIENINYFNLVDIYYFGFLRFLTRVTASKNKQKIFSLTSEIISDALMKIIISYSSKDIEFNDKEFITLAISYLLITQYSDQPKQQTLNNLIKLEKRESIKAKLKNSKLTKYTKFEDIVYVLAEEKIINITPNALIKQLNDTFGKNFFNFTYEFDSLVAYLCSLNHRSEIFISKYSSTNKNDKLKYLEDLISNAKGNVLYKPLV